MTWLAILLLGCTNGESADPRSSGSDGDAPAAPSEAPEGFSVVAGEGFTIAVPPGFVSEVLTASNGEPALIARPDEADGKRAASIAVLRDSDPRAGVAEQAETLVRVKRTVDRATQLTQEPVEWPGTREAILVQWTVELQDEGGVTSRMRTWQLLAQVSEDLILNVVAAAPVESFEASGVSTALQTFRPEDTA